MVALAIITVEADGIASSMKVLKQENGNRFCECQISPGTGEVTITVTSIDPNERAFLTISWSDLDHGQMYASGFLAQGILGAVQDQEYGSQLRYVVQNNMASGIYHFLMIHLSFVRPECIIPGVDQTLIYASPVDATITKGSFRFVQASDFIGSDNATVNLTLGG